MPSAPIRREDEHIFSVSSNDGLVWHQGPGWWRWPRPPHPDPDPEPWWRDIFGGVIGAVGGIGAAVIIGPDYQGMGLLETAVLGFGGGVFLGSVGNGLMGAARG